jgi:hypothetical protein
MQNKPDINRVAIKWKRTATGSSKKETKSKTSNETRKFSGNLSGPRPIGIRISHEAQISVASQPGIYRDKASIGLLDDAVKMNHPKYKPAIK